MRGPVAGPPARGVQCCRAAGGVGCLRFPWRRDVLRRGGSASGVRVRGPAAADPAAVRRVGRAAGSLRPLCGYCPALEMALVVVLVALICRDLGGTRRAQILAACTAALSGYLGAGHLDTTTDPDLLAWAVIVWLVVRLLDGGDPRQWLAVGRGGDRTGEQGHRPVPRRGAGRRARPGPALGRHALPVGLGGLGDRRPALGAEPAWQATNGWPQLTMASRSRGTPPTTVPRSCRCCGCSPGRCCSRSAPPDWSGSWDRRRPRPGVRSGSRAWWRWRSSSSPAARPTT